MASGPATDRMEDAPDLSSDGASSGSAPWDNTAATNIEGKGNYTFGNVGVWHKVTAGAGYAHFQHDISVSGDTYMYVFQGPANATNVSQLTLIGYDDDSAGNLHPQVTISNGAAGVYWILSTGYGGNRYGNGQKLQWQVPVPYVPQSRAFASTVQAKATVAARADVNLVPISGAVHGSSQVDSSVTLIGPPLPIAIVHARATVGRASFTVLRQRGLLLFVTAGRSVDNSLELELEARLGTDTRQNSDPEPTRTQTASYS